MRQALAVLAMAVIIGMALLHPGIALGVIAFLIVAVLVVFAVLFYLLGAPPDTNDHSN